MQLPRRCRPRSVEQAQQAQQYRTSFASTHPRTGNTQLLHSSLASAAAQTRVDCRTAARTCGASPLCAPLGTARLAVLRSDSKKLLHHFKENRHSWQSDCEQGNPKVKTVDYERARPAKPASMLSVDLEMPFVHCSFALAMGLGANCQGLPRWQRAGLGPLISYRACQEQGLLVCFCLLICMRMASCQEQGLLVCFCLLICKRMASPGKRYKCSGQVTQYVCLMTGN